MELKDRIKIDYFYSVNGEWFSVPEAHTDMRGMEFKTDGACYRCELSETENGFKYRLSFKSEYITQLRLRISISGAENCFHLIPSNIFGDNNISGSGLNEAPFLTKKRKGDAFAAERWELKADRAAVPLAALAFEGGAVGISVPPYTDNADCAKLWQQAPPVFEREPEERYISRLNDKKPSLTPLSYIANGLFAELPGAVGVSLGYTNDPVTFTNKHMPNPPSANLAKAASAEGEIYIKNGGKESIHEMVRAEYLKLCSEHKRAEHSKTLSEAAAGLVNAFVNMNFDKKAGEYTNMKCHPELDTVLKPWREVTENGWTGGAVLAYPLVLSRFVPGAVCDETFSLARSGEEMFDRIVNSQNPISGLFGNVMKPMPGKNDLNSGKWGKTENEHCTYIFAEATYYILKTIIAFKNRNMDYPKKWLDACVTVLDTMIETQREDGAMGVIYRADKKGVSDWDGFAGCWFVPATACAYKLLGDERYISSARKALMYYHQFVKDLKCFGTPLDTKKAVDQEGNLAFIKGSRLMYEYTGEKEYLDCLIDGANYEYLWRYAFNSRPICEPLNDGWRSKGGSITSVSHPHIHPMGVIVDSDLRFLYKCTGDKYHLDRAEDSTAWIMQNLERYPQNQGYGIYGVLSERWCPSDGLTIDSYSCGKPASTWFSYNLWASACALEAICEKFLETQDNP